MAASKPVGIGYLQVLTKAISSVTATPEYDPGTRVQYQGDEYTYIHVKGTTAPVGYAVTLSASTGYSATISAATDVDKAFGVVKHTDIPTGEYGWVVIRGFAPAIAGNNTGLALLDNVYMVGTSNTGNISRITANTIYSQSNGAAAIPFGQCVQAAATAAAGTIYIF